MASIRVTESGVVIVKVSQQGPAGPPGSGATGGWGVPTEKTIVAGVVTLDGEGYYKIETEGGADTDNLAQILGLSIGDQVILEPANDAHTIVLIKGAYFHIGVNFTMDSIYDKISLICRAVGECDQLYRASGGD